MSIFNRAQLEAAFIANGCQAVTVITWNKLSLMCVLEGGEILASVVQDCGPDHGKLAGSPRAFKFVQQARTWFFTFTDTMER